MITKRKNRYLLIGCSSELNENIMDYFYSSLHNFMGSKNYANANPKIVKTYPNKMFIVRVNRGSEKEVVLATAFSKNYNEKLGFYSIITSGTIKTISDKIKIF
ncbi:MAG: Rpp14/Pop5 family protein [Candidatus Micrarchaeaceae archaeon]